MQAMESFLFSSLSKAGPYSLIAIALFYLRAVTLAWLRGRRGAANVRSLTRWYMRHGYSAREAVDTARADVLKPKPEVQPEISGVRDSKSARVDELIKSIRAFVFSRKR